MNKDIVHYNIYTVSLQVQNSIPCHVNYDNIIANRMSRHSIVMWRICDAIRGEIVGRQLPDTATTVERMLAGVEKHI
jgi:hypothetical protein